MRTIDIIKRAGRSLRQAKVRTLLTSMAIGVGAFTLTLAFAAGEGARRYADDFVSSNINPKTLFIVKDSALFDGPSRQAFREYDPDVGSMQGGGPTVAQLNNDDVEALTRRPDLTNVVPTYQIAAEYFEVEGHSKKYTGDITAYDSGVRSAVASGSLPELGTSVGDYEIIVPEDLAKVLGASNDSLVGKKVTLTVKNTTSVPTSQQEIATLLQNEGPAGLARLAEGETRTFSFTVRGVSKAASTSLAAGASMQVSPTTAKEVVEFATKGSPYYQKYLGVTAIAAGDNEPVAVKEALKKDGYSAQTAQDLQGILFTVANVLQGIVSGFAVLALIASVFGIINTMYISVLERTGQIGLMKALGMRSRDISRLFRYEAAWIGFIGGVIGVGIAYLAGFLLNPLIKMAPGFEDGSIQLVFLPLPMLLIIIGLMLVAVVAGFFPSRKAARLDPIEALRTE